MLPRVATTTGTSQPSLAPQAGATVDAAIKPQLSAAAIANLRAEVLLRLLETMLRHMPRSAEPNPSRNLLETLLAVLKALPGRGGERGGKLADLLANLPQEVRPSVEKLIGTVLSSMPTRSLVEVVRNPNGPEAQKLATLLAASLDVDDRPAAGGERQQKPRGLTAQQIAAVGRHGTQQTDQAQQVFRDARVLQTTLKRIFDLDDASATARTAEAGRPALTGTSRLPAEAREEHRLPTPTAKAGNPPLAEAAEAATGHDASAEETQTATPTSKREDRAAEARIANSAGRALARSVLHAVTRDMPVRALMQAVAHLVENLSPEDANFLRTLLERPLDPASAEEMNSVGVDRPEAAGEQALDAETPAEGGKARPETTQSTSTTSRQIAEQDHPSTPQASETVQTAPVADTTPDNRLFPAAMLREGVPLAFVPYLPAEEDLDWTETRDEASDEDRPDGDGENHDEDGEDAEFEAPGDEPEAADMVRRREKTAQMVGVIEPGLVFYQKLGDYWT